METPDSAYAKLGMPFSEIQSFSEKGESRGRMDLTSDKSFQTVGDSKAKLWPKCFSLYIQIDRIEEPPRTFDLDSCILYYRRILNFKSASSYGNWQKCSKFYNFWNKINFACDLYCIRNFWEHNYMQKMWLGESQPLNRVKWHHVLTYKIGYWIGKKIF